MNKVTTFFFFLEFEVVNPAVSVQEDEVQSEAPNVDKVFPHAEKEFEKETSKSASDEHIPCCAVVSEPENQNLASVSAPVCPAPVHSDNVRSCMAVEIENQAQKTSECHSSLRVLSTTANISHVSTPVCPAPVHSDNVRSCMAVEIENQAQRTSECHSSLRVLSTTANISQTGTPAKTEEIVEIRENDPEVLKDDDGGEEPMQIPEINEPSGQNSISSTSPDVNSVLCCTDDKIEPITVLPPISSQSDGDCDISVKEEMSTEISRELSPMMNMDKIDVYSASDFPRSV